MVHIAFRDKEVFTTGEVTEACPGVSQQTIIRCIDQGLLEGYHVPDRGFVAFDDNPF